MKQLKFKDANNKSLIEGIDHILGMEPPAKVSYALSTALKTIMREVESFNKEHYKLILKYCVLNKDGTPKVGKDKNVPFKTKEDGDAFVKEMQGLEDVEFECYTVKLSDLNEVQKLKGTIVSSLLPIINDES